MEQINVLLHYNLSQNSISVTVVYATGAAQKQSPDWLW